MLYNLSMPLDRERFAARANALLQKGSVVDLTEKTLRTHNQNSYLHLIIGAVAMDVGVTLEYAKREYSRGLLTEICLSGRSMTDSPERLRSSDPPQT